ncbi:hypothetical protein GGG16DRAFT_68470 [Schizophyllum commune]|nr:uncharacterized protein SCHCODRAFT_02490274 [Schizophyllum commune H4-8]XP_003037701.1 uncharacterized protein SCHCODRAFT_02486818 [Schizophyllum commune H4-8]KAI5897310.1 hypothetical protein SCHCODRAFT_02486818 [Schizophyllum commune H4-8]KAI5897430.1 hypothetical protein SCHCODRAFT_02490274 [Schizophyllum commune H4-8]
MQVLAGPGLADASSRTVSKSRAELSAPRHPPSTVFVCRCYDPFRVTYDVFETTYGFLRTMFDVLRTTKIPLDALHSPPSRCTRDTSGSSPRSNRSSSGGRGDSRLRFANVVLRVADNALRDVEVARHPQHPPANSRRNASPTIPLIRRARIKS